MNSYIFVLGREWKLSLAELGNVFGWETLEGYTEHVALFTLPEPLNGNCLETLGGTIRIIHVYATIQKEDFAGEVLANITKRSLSGKISFALGVYGDTLPLTNIGLQIKRQVQATGKTARMINAKDENIHSAVFKKERLAKTGQEYILLPSPLKNKQGSYVFGVTIACQDIDAYTRRDTAKIRNMHIGMMPPKLVQILLNIALHTTTPPASPSDTILYDPFCGLSTTLIEGLQRGLLHVLGSDVSQNMVDASKKNIDAFIAHELLWEERIKKAGGIPKKDITQVQTKIWKMNSEYIASGTTEELIERKKSTIVSEGYLGEILNTETVTLEKIHQEKEKLIRLYTNFFGGLKKIGATGTVVMTFPFWRLHETFHFFDTLYPLLKQCDFEIIPLIPPIPELLTPQGSLLYIRPNQTVGREVIAMRLIQ